MQVARTMDTPLRLPPADSRRAELNGGPASGGSGLGVRRLLGAEDAHAKLERQTLQVFQRYRAKTWQLCQYRKKVTCWLASIPFLEATKCHVVHKRHTRLIK